LSRRSGGCHERLGPDPAGVLHRQADSSTPGRPNTVGAYRDTCRLLLEFATRATGVTPSELDIGDLDAALITAFLTPSRDRPDQHPRQHSTQLTSPWGVDMNYEERFFGSHLVQHVTHGVSWLDDHNHRLDPRLVAYSGALAAVCGGLITVLAGTVRIFQLRRTAKKNLKALSSRP
jgi:hypothetical protein